MSFGADMAKIIAKTNIKAEELGRAVKLETFAGAINDTRVKTGRLKGNWQTSEGSPNTGEIDRLDPTGSEAISEVESTVQGISLSYLTNNLPYAPVIEEMDGMVEKNIRKVKRNIAKQARRLAK